MKTLLITLAILVSVQAKPANCDDLRFSFAISPHLAGHSYSKYNGVKEGFGGHFSIQKNWVDTSAVTVRYGTTIFAYTYDKKHNSETEGEAYRYTTQYGVTPTFDITLYFNTFWRIHPFLKTGVGFELSTDEKILPVGILGYGVEADITKTISLEFSAIKIISDVRRYDYEAYGGVKYSF